MTPSARTTTRVATAACVAALAPAPLASAVDHSQGTPGFCPTDQGVTVVIDFGALGGDTLVRCNPTTGSGSGLAALQGAGIQITGVQRWGESFVCRIENKPASTQRLTIPGDDGYREACIDTPPAEAYWSYWHAGNNCAWSYSQWGAKNRDFIQGGFEGWTFSLGASAEQSAQGLGPRIPAARPGTEDQTCGATAEPAPRTNDRDEKAPTPAQPNRDLSPGSKAGSADSAGTGSSPTASGGSTTAGPSARASVGLDATERTESEVPGAIPRTADAREGAAQEGVAFTGGEDAPDLSESEGRGPWGAALLVGVLTLLGTGVWRTRRRRVGGMR